MALFSAGGRPGPRVTMEHRGNLLQTVWSICYKIQRTLYFSTTIVLLQTVWSIYYKIERNSYFSNTQQSYCKQIDPFTTKSRGIFIFLQLKSQYKQVGLFTTKLRGHDISTIHNSCIAKKLAHLLQNLEEFIFLYTIVLLLKGQSICYEIALHYHNGLNDANRLVLLLQNREDFKPLCHYGLTANRLVH